MRNWLFGTISVAAVIVTAACNSGGEGGNGPATANEQRNEAASNVASGTGTPQDHAAVMKARHDHYEAMGKAMKGIGDQLKSSEPELAEVRRHAATIAGFAPQMKGWFPPGSGPETGRETRAKAEIWSDRTTFDQRTQAFEVQAANFNRVAQGTDLAGIRAASAELGTSCKNCHDRFRAPEDD